MLRFRMDNKQELTEKQKSQLLSLNRVPHGRDLLCCLPGGLALYLQVPLLLTVSLTLGFNLCQCIVHSSLACQCTAPSTL